MAKAFIKRLSTSVGTEHGVREKVRRVLRFLQKSGPLSVKQLEYCDEVCVTRFLKAKGNHAKKAAKQLRATLSWRATLDADYLTADEFSAELAAGTAFVAGHDDEGRPVLIVKLKPEHLATSQSQKQFLRYFVFTMEVAIACMPWPVEHCVLILDAGSLKKGSPGLSMIVHLLRMLGDHYPERVARTFVVDPPSIFYYIWKGIGPFLDLGLREKLRFVFSRNYNGTSAASHLIRAARSYSSRNLWAEQSDTEEEDKFSFNSTMPILSRNQAMSPVPDNDSTPKFRQSWGAALISDKKQGRSLSFASSGTTSGWANEAGTVEFRSFRTDTAQVRRRDANHSVLQDGSRRWADISSTCVSREDQQPAQPDNYAKERTVDIFRPYLNLFRSSYHEPAYRARMKPPLGGLISIISPELNRHVSFTFEDKGMEAILHRLNLD